MGKKKHHHQKLRKKGMAPGTLLYTGNRTEDTSATTVWYAEEKIMERNYYAPELGESQTGVTWIDIRSLTNAQLIEEVGTNLGIHPLALEDVLDTTQRAKLEEYDNGLFIILPALRFDNVSIDLISEQIAVFVGHAVVVSFQEDPDDTLAPIRKRATDGVGRIRKRGADYLGYCIIDTIVDGYYLVMDDIDGKLFELEAQMHRGAADTSCKAKIFELKQVVGQFKHRMVPLRDAVTRFQRSDSDVVAESSRLYLRDVVDHVSQILDGIDNQRNTLSDLESLYHTEASNRLNNVMRLLTVISTIFMPLSFIASVYGMNFDVMPELRSPYGYHVVLGVMFCIMCGMLVYFRVKKWI